MHFFRLSLLTLFIIPSSFAINKPAHSFSLSMAIYITHKIIKKYKSLTQVKMLILSYLPIKQSLHLLEPETHLFQVDAQRLIVNMESKFGFMK